MTASAAELNGPAGVSDSSRGMRTLFMAQVPDTLVGRRLFRAVSRATVLRTLSLLVIATPVLGSLGCAVPQPRGQGKLDRLTEPQTRRAYYLYLPKDYVESSEAQRARQRWPLVVSFHGMKPYDVAHAQAREWQQEADRYGFIVVAPVLNTVHWLSPIFGGFPVRKVTSSFQKDEQAVLAILDHVFATTRADPSNVLSTSWSSGGYMAHYMLNRHPDRFTALAVRQSNFSSSVLDAQMTSKSRYHPVLILMTQNDIAICKRESQQAIEWYQTHGYKNVGWVELRSLGHQRTPDTAADFFARLCNKQPNRPPTVLTSRQAIDGNQTGLAMLKGDLAGLQNRPQRDVANQTTPRQRSTASGNGPATPAQPRPQRPRNDTATARRASRSGETPHRRRDHREEPQEPLVGIRVSSAVGFEPLLIAYSAECPTDWHRSADFRWSLNGEGIGRGLNGQKTIGRPGDYTLGLHVVTADGNEYRTHRRIRVLKSLEANSAPAGQTYEIP